jgi:outer membrane protein OmpA-like peptidoglycan-associated protein
MMRAIAWAAVAATLALCQEMPTPVFKVDVVSKSAKAINYERGTGSTRIDFVGTALAPQAKGSGEVESKKGYIQVEAKFEGLESAQKFGAEYLTYVLWSISPEGRVSNLGEIILKNGKGRLNVTTELQIFGLFITAEPYFAVRQPSDLIVLDNELRKDTRGKVYIIESKLELLKRGQYAKLANPLELRVDTKNVPLELYQARNALQVAKSMGADKYAMDVYSKAEASLKMAELYPQDQRFNDEIIRTGRQAVQIAEDARAIAVERREQERLQKEREKMQNEREAALKKAAEEAQARLAADQRSAEAEAERKAAEARSAGDQQKRLQAELAAAQAAQRSAEAEAARAKALQAASAAEKAAASAEQAREQAEAERKGLRERLLRQFNQALPTRDTERGLVVNIGDVLFDSGKFELRQPAREKLARLAGICLAYPGLRLEAEGHTDNVGSDELNQKLSEQRAFAVRSFLLEQGLDPSRAMARGYGKSSPVADNTTSQGRQQNRRVEIVVSGEVIGNAVGR